MHVLKNNNITCSYACIKYLLSTFILAHYVNKKNLNFMTPFTFLFTPNCVSFNIYINTHSNNTIAYMDHGKIVQCIQVDRVMVCMKYTKLLMFSLIWEVGTQHNITIFIYKYTSHIVHIFKFLSIYYSFFTFYWKRVVTIT